MTDDAELPTRAEVVLAGHTGDVATARAGLDASHPITRSSALAALVRLDAENADDLTAAIADESPAVRARAATTLVRSRRDPAVRLELVSRLLDDTDDRVLEAACFAAGEITPTEPGVVRLLCTIATSHDDSLCRESAVAALGSLGAEEGRAAVLAACDDRATVRRRAVLALAVFDGPDVDAALVRLRDDRDVQVRQAAEDLMSIAEGDEF
ncbi:MAG TPA: HEAT repeat domain-containing protein [Microthrixaceae bacterium]|nr:HEAT repeat domain-containing protein [Microthrixaceae bacterium]